MGVDHVVWWVLPVWWMMVMWCGGYWPCGLVGVGHVVWWVLVLWCDRCWPCGVAGVDMLTVPLYR